MAKPFSYVAARLASELLDGAFSDGRTDRAALEQAIAKALDQAWSTGARDAGKVIAKQLTCALRSRHSAAEITQIIVELKRAAQ